MERELPSLDVAGGLDYRLPGLGQIEELFQL